MHEDKSTFLAVKDTLFSSNLRFNAQGILHEFGNPIVMGILNTTPDSFYSKSRIASLEMGMASAKKMITEGATILDIGGFSSRPGACEVSEAQETERTVSLIREIRAAFPETLISIDTFRARVAEKALEAGANLINDISGGQLDPSIFNVAANFQAPFIMMHMRNHPTRMMEDTFYDNLIPDLIRFFSNQIEKAQKAGIKDIIIDPGFGFSKTREQNFSLLKHIQLLLVLEKSILVGISRKSMIYKTLNITPEESLNGTTVINTIALQNGAKILRVHDVKAAVEAVKLVGYC